MFIKDLKHCISLSVSLLLMSALVFGNSEVAANTSEASRQLTLEQAIQIAQNNDPWLESNEYRQQSISAQSTAAGSLPDPMVSISVANLPVDSFDFSQEAMTQLKFGVTQALPRGDSLELSQKRLQQLSQEFPLQRQNRKAQVKAAISQLWLEIFLTAQTIELIEQDRPLFEQLAETASINYSSAMVQTSQQDVIRAQVELTRLDDRLSQLRQQLTSKKAQLSEWLTTSNHSQWAMKEFQLPDHLPAITLSSDDLLSESGNEYSEKLIQHLSSHPQLVAFEQKIQASDTSIELAKQSYKPQWNLNASYGYRDDDPMGNSRSDFFSVGVSFDVPLFTENRQDQQVTSSIKEREAYKADKWLMLRNMLASVRNFQGQLIELDNRRQLFNNKLLQEMQQQAEATLNAYTNDRGDFAEVMRARIAELNTKIDAMTVEVSYLKTIVQLNYLFTQAEQ
ncbi:transporter [Kangiella profundi]|uniref:Transporter n=1 Tax=Kangiella profundi TaxID=1561924 RepID=A0A2K9ALV2_9GAMM|nr:TolC family protein [Kangiella profundi]AUD78612.1 transporter [Kangiella profundi]GGF09432.1 copper transporter [Kangiella profundi]